MEHNKIDRKLFNSQITQTPQILTEWGTDKRKSLGIGSIKAVKIRTLQTIIRKRNERFRFALNVGVKETNILCADDSTT